MNKTWFRARRSGLGWYPVSVEGWLAASGYVIALAAGEMFLMSKLAITGSWLDLTAFLVYATSLTMLFMRVCETKGERLQFRWWK